MNVTSSDVCTAVSRDGELGLLSRIFEQRLGSGDGVGVRRRVPRQEQARLITDFCQLLKQLSALMHISGDQDARRGLDPVLDRLMSLISGALEAERSTLFLYDPDTDELYSRVAQGELHGEIRMPAWRGIAGTVFRSGVPIVISDAYADPRFNPRIDEQTGYRTRSVLCVPLKNWDDRIIGVTQVLNRRSGAFDGEDQALLEALTGHAAAALESRQVYESFEKALHDEEQLLGVTLALSSELNLDSLLAKIMSISSDLLDADRSTLLLYDAVRGELRSKVAEGLEGDEIHLPAGSGIAGTVFHTGRTVNITDAYADPRFNPRIDRDTGYRTRSILCVPVETHSHQRLGIIQVLNKRGGPFTARDEERLKALAVQAAIAIDNARLFEDVLNARNYSESILQSLSNGVITLDARRRVIKANPAASRILGRDRGDLQGMTTAELFDERNPWISELLDRVDRERHPEAALDADIRLADDAGVAVNLNIEPLIDVKHQPIGSMLIMEDITTEKRVKSTMARYMSHDLAERLLESGESILGGQAQAVSVLFSDIRNFTRMAESLGARDTVSMLNEYFSEMVELVFRYGGVLDKYIGDAMMAVFGTPFPGPDDADHAVTVAVEMVRALRALNDRRLLEGREPIETRLGISTGEVIAGNIGSPRRMDYTVIGHNVNIASRLESANQFYGTRILICEATRRALRGEYRLRELDLVRVKGSVTPLSIFEVLDGRDPAEFPDARGLARAFADGLARYRRRDWKPAQACFRRALGIWPGDGPSRLYLSRCAHYEQAPPAEDWDGVWSMTHK